MPGQSAFGGRWWMWSMVLTIATIALTFAVLSIAPRPVITAWLGDPDRVPKGVDSSARHFAQRVFE